MPPTVSFNVFFLLILMTAQKCNAADGVTNKSHSIFFLLFLNLFFNLDDSPKRQCSRRRQKTHSIFQYFILLFLFFFNHDIGVGVGIQPGHITLTSGATPLPPPPVPAKIFLFPCHRRGRGRGHGRGCRCGCGRGRWVKGFSQFSNSIGVGAAKVHVNSQVNYPSARLSMNA